MPHPTSMKRKVNLLVEYSSSESEDESPGSSEDGQVLVKKRKLPPVPSSLVPATHVDDPTLHQGRIRTIPHVEGQFAAHVYVSVVIRRHTLLYKAVQDILEEATAGIPTLHKIDILPEDSRYADLHISLTRPIFLRPHQRDELKRAVRNTARNHKPFTLSFTVLSELINDEKTRTFLTMEVGAGHHELHTLSKALGPVLRSIRQQEYYPDPRFHASIAWALLHRANSNLASHSVLSDSICTPQEPLDDSPTSLADITGRETASIGVFSTIPRLPSEVIVALNTKYGPILSSPKVGCFDVEAVSVKIGKDVSSWKLSGL